VKKKGSCQSSKMDLQLKVEELERKNRELEATLKDREVKTLQVNKDTPFMKPENHHSLNTPGSHVVHYVGDF